MLVTCVGCMGAGKVTIYGDDVQCTHCAGTGKTTVLTRPATEPERCIIPQCGNVRSARGLCAKCYSEANNAIKRKETSWKELQELGLCYGKGTPFTRALRQARNNKPQDTQ